MAQSPRTVLPGHVETSATASDLVHVGGTVAVAPGIETSLIWPIANALSELVPKNQAVLKGFVYSVHLVFFAFGVTGTYGT